MYQLIFYRTRDSILKFSNLKFLDLLKTFNIGFVHKKNDTTDNKNYRPVIVLSLIFKGFEKVM